eukprot:3840426-Amphidinium_carterae.1
MLAGWKTHFTWDSLLSLALVNRCAETKSHSCSSHLQAQARSAAARELVAIHEAGHALIGAAFAHLTQQRLARVSIRWA